jgi:hypothetical protein
MRLRLYTIILLLFSRQNFLRHRLALRGSVGWGGKSVRNYRALPWAVLVARGKGRSSARLKYRLRCARLTDTALKLSLHTKGGSWASQHYLASSISSYLLPFMLIASSTSEAIHASARQHAELLRGIGELDYAQPALEQCTSYLKDLEEQKTQSESELRQLSKKTEKERAEHIDIKNSVARKWSNKLVGRGEKFQKKVTKEEKWEFSLHTKICF